MEIVWALNEISDLSELKGEDFFKVRAYRQAAKNLAGLTCPIEKLYNEGTLRNIPGVGKNIFSKIAEMLETGKIDLLEGLRKEIPPGILEVMSIPGVGPKRARLFYEQLGISNIKELEHAAKKRLIRNIRGMGAKRELEILHNIKMLKNNIGKFQLSIAREVACHFTEYLNTLDFVNRVSVTGSVRRWKEMVRDLDILVETVSPGEMFSAFDAHPMVASILHRDNQRIKLITHWGLPVEIIMVPPVEFIPALLRTTGSLTHWNEILEIARNKGIFFDKLSFSSEEDLYECLGLSFVPPEMREGRGELDLVKSGKPLSLVHLENIRGDLHIHSNWSDGGNTIEELVEKARSKGYNYIAITDHSHSLKIARGLSIDRLRQQHNHIKSLNKKLKDFYIFTGIEVDILSDGRLDYPDEILADIDIVIASVHSAFKQDKNKMTARIIAAIENPHVNIIGHLTGRLLGHRHGYDIDVNKIVEKAAEHKTVLEINSSPDRLDLDENNARLAAKRGVKMAIGTDAHDLRRMDEMCYGVAVARRAGLGPGDILNTMELPDILNFWSNSNE